MCKVISCASSNFLVFFCQILIVLCSSSVIYGLVGWIDTQSWFVSSLRSHYPYCCLLHSFPSASPMGLGCAVLAQFLSEVAAARFCLSTGFCYSDVGCPSFLHFGLGFCLSWSIFFSVHLLVVCHLVPSYPLFLASISQTSFEILVLKVFPNRCHVSCLVVC